jgi:16S rRNA processing protein RimM
MYNLDKEKGSWFCLGKFIKTYGYKGDLVMLLDTDFPEKYADLEVIFVDMEGSLVPWFIQEIRIKDDLATLQIEEITGPDEAGNFLKRDVYLPVEKLEKKQGNAFYFHEITGFEVKDKTHGNIGRVDAILERREQEIIRIISGKKEILIPLTDQMITKVDRKKKVLHIDTPEGLIDLYL